MSEVGVNIGTAMIVLGGIVWLLFAHRLGPRGGIHAPLINTSHVYLFDFLCRALAIGGIILCAICSD